MRAYGWLLHLYPASFRNEYGDEMRRLFAQRYRDAGAAARIALWVATVAEVAGNAALVHADILRSDLRYTGRTFKRSPGFVITAIGVMALGIGATTAAFTVTDYVLIRPLPFRDPDRLVTFWLRTPGYDRMELSAPNYRDLKGAVQSLESAGVYHSEVMTLMNGSEPHRFEGASVSADLFPSLGVAPVLGRTFSDADDRPGAAPTLMLSYRLWQTEFGGDPAVLGRTVPTKLDVDGGQFTIVGVMPRVFRYPYADTQFWVTNRFGASDYAVGERDNYWLYGVGRLRPGATLQQLRAELDVAAARLRQEYPKPNKDVGATAFLLNDLVVPERSRTLLVALSGASACLLVIACANLASLLLARALGRRRELAVRTAIGAGRDRLVRQLMTESLLLAFVGGALGVGLAVVSVPLLTQLVPATLPLPSAPAVDARVLAFAVVLIVATGVGFGLTPILRVGASPDLDGLREGARSGGGRKERLRSALVVAEIAATVVLLVSAGLLIRALLSVQAVDPGFNPENVLTLRAELPLPEYEKVATRQEYYTRVLSQVRALPGVRAAGFSSFLPMSSFRGGIWPIAVPGNLDTVNGAKNNAAIRIVTPGFFDAMGIPLRRGRDVTEADGTDRQYVAVVSESFAKRYWPGENPIGRHFHFDLSFPFASAEREIVGIVGDVRFRGLERVSEPQVYLSSAQATDGAVGFYAPRALALRTNVPPEQLAMAVRDVVHRADARVVINQMQTLSDLVTLETVSRSVQVRVLSGFAALAFILAAVGIHGLLSFAVSQRLQEFSVRMALGAQPGDILRMVLRQSFVLAGVGVIPGVVVAYWWAMQIQAVLFGVKPADPATYAAAVALAVVMTIAGSLLPTLRAVRVNPITAIRAE